MKKVFLGLVFLAGCSQSSSLSVTAKIGGTSQALMSNQTTANKDLVLSRARVLINELELHEKAMGAGKGEKPHAGGPGKAGHGGGGGNCPNMGGKGGSSGEKGHGPVNGPQHDEPGPYVIDLQGDALLSGATKSFPLGDVKAGTYNEAVIEVEPIDDETAWVTDAALDDFKKNSASVLMEGTYKGVAFSYVSKLHIEQPLPTPLTISDKLDLQLAVDPTQWFLDTDGSALDPTDAAAHDKIAESICRSISFGDQDHAASNEGKVCTIQ